MESNTKIQLTLWQEDSLANHSQSQASDLDQRMTVTSGLRCYESSESAGHVGSLEKMFLASSKWHSTMCHLTWKEKATPSGRLYFQLSPSMRSTEEIDVSLLPTKRMWPTPTTRDHKGGYVGGRIRNGKVSWDTLDVAVQHTDNQEKNSGQLNPEFVEYLMGFPIGWTESNP
tara:strand:- start:57 stop:572 length:516 start_codon:yes stop_codon:yes gene_type:complete